MTKWIDTSRLLVDTNVLVLFAVGAVNRQRIQTFKRSSQYAAQDFDLLLDAFAGLCLLLK